MNDNYNEVDFVIVGAGPGGLTLAYILAKYGKSVILIDREASIGGCHRVRRYGPNKLFTEHGPRIYGTNYLSTRVVLESLGVNWEESFTPYAFFLNNISNNVLSELTFSEIIAYARGFISFLINPKPTEKITVGDFMRENNFSAKGRDFIERICRLTDGAGPDRYTLWEFFELINQNFAYTIVQPVVPNDVGFLKNWENALVGHNVRIMLNTEVKRIQTNNSRITSILVQNEAGVRQICGKNFIFAIPLWNLVEILKNSDSLVQGAYGPFRKLIEYTIASEYITYIPVTLHWNTKLVLPKQWGYPRGNWQVGVLVLSDYMKFDNPESKTVISTVITNVNAKSAVTNKTANESTPEEVVNEVIREVGKMYKGLPPPTTTIISPEMSKVNTNNQEHWRTVDKAFILTPIGFLPVPSPSSTSTLRPKTGQSPILDNMYVMGQYIGKSTSAFTSMEGAVTNALALAHELIPQSQKEFPIIKPVTVRKLIVTLAMAILLLYLIYKFKLSK